MKKRVLGILLCLLMLGTVATAFVGCGGENYDLYVAALDGGYGKGHWETLAKEFESKTGKKVKLVAESNIEKIIDPQLKAGEGPDVIYVAKGRPEKLTETLLAGNKIMDLTSLLTEEVESGKKFNEVITTQALEAVVEADGKTYMLPLFVGLSGLFYDANKFYANDGNGSYSGVKNGKYELPATWKEFKELGATLTIATTALFTYPTAGYMDAFIPSSIASSAGMDKLKKAFMYEDNIWNDADVNAVFKELENIKPYVYTKCVAQGSSEFKKNQQAVIDGDVLFMCNGDWVKAEMEDTTPAEFIWGTMPALAFSDSGTRYTPANVEQIYMPTSAKNVETGKEFLKFIYSEQGQKIIAKDSNDAIVPTKAYATLAKNDIPEGVLDGYKGYLNGSMVAINAYGWASVDTNKLPASTPGWSDVLCKFLEKVWGTENKTAADWIADLETNSDLFRAAIKA